MIIVKFLYYASECVVSYCGQNQIFGMQAPTVRTHLASKHHILDPSLTKSLIHPPSPSCFQYSIKKWYKSITK